MAPSKHSTKSGNTKAKENEFSFGCEVEILVKPKMGKSPFTKRLKKLEFDPSIPSQPVSAFEPGPDDTAGKKLKKDQEKNRKAIRTALAEALNRVFVTAKAYETSSNTTKIDYTAWAIMDEGALDEPEGFWRVESVSKTENIDSIADPKRSWVQDIRRFFAVLGENCDLKVTTGCSMHVHVSPGVSTKFNECQLQAICKAICYWDTVTTAILPLHRKASTWAASNCADIRNPMLKDKPMNESVNKNLVAAYKSVSQKGWKIGLFDSYFGKGQVTLHSVYSLMSGSTNLDNGRRSRYVGWNFQHVTDKCGTIEFRRPPGVDTADDALYWICFTVGFVSQAIRTDWNDKRYDKVGKLGTGDLDDFVRSGLRGIPSLRNTDPASIGLQTLTRHDGKVQWTQEEIDKHNYELKQQIKKRQRGEDQSNFALIANTRRANDTT
ncbi:hypothetical protein V8F06_005502 [Rhypophila decipiens]